MQKRVHVGYTTEAGEISFFKENERGTSFLEEDRRENIVFSD
jgi:hypothetical protein